MAKKITTITPQDILELAKAKNMTLSTLTKLTGISRSHLSLMFNGHRNMTLVKMNKLIEAINEYSEK